MYVNKNEFLQSYFIFMRFICIMLIVIRLTIIKPYIKICNIQKNTFYVITLVSNKYKMSVY